MFYIQVCLLTVNFYIYQSSSFFYISTFNYSTNICRKYYAFSTELHLQRFQSSIDHICFSLSAICSIVLCIYPFTHTTCPSFIRETFFQLLKSRKVSFNFVVVSQYCFGSIIHLSFQIIFRIRLFIFTKHLVSFDEDFIKSKDQFGKNWHLNYISRHIQKQFLNQVIKLKTGSKPYNQRDPCLILQLPCILYLHTVGGKMHQIT